MRFCSLEIMEPNWKKLGIATACCAGASVLLVKLLTAKWVQKKIQRAKLRSVASLQMAENSVLQFREKCPGVDADTILSLSLAELTKKLKEGPLSPDMVLHTYMGKALEVNRKLNCATEFLLESRDQLDEVEAHREGLLYGVPVSIKENLGYKGHDSSCGVVCKLEQPADADSVVVQVLKKQGAIPFVKTNVPQGLLNYDCSNPIFGQTLNPHNLQKTSGGSSGGEGALIGGGGSILGIGTDIGGSIRIPAAFCGICGFKPTANRLSSCCRGQKSVLSSLGPLARSVNDLALCMKALLCEDMFSLDPTVPPLPFNEQEYLSSKPLRIGYYENEGYQLPSPSMRRALREVKDLLERAGHTLVPFTPPRISYVMHELLIRGVLADRGETLLRNLKEGPTDPCLRSQTIIYNEYCFEFISEWRKKDLDVLLSPMLGPAFNFRYCGKLTCALNFTMIYNLLNLPAGVVPVSTVTDADEEELKHYKGNFGDLWDRVFKKSTAVTEQCWHLQAVSGAQGLPVAVQCISLPWRDELCLRFMREVEQLVRDHRNK
ncbi:hypothetical protein JZ751_019052 [Albula glossodonta]|uniref:Fatty-acid amide hydrolase 1 n=1 Tax=Albula glossodonta TaxID=121402 RepID=A0A8T2NPJ1_9TELE|nr:hypothetical protein JZ751_019052 [Albula glossodonta]